MKFILEKKDIEVFRIENGVRIVFKKAINLGEDDTIEFPMIPLIPEKEE